MCQVEESWLKRLKPEMEKPYFRRLRAFVEEEYAFHTIYPPKELIFNAFRFCFFEEVKVVILGQDPYIKPGQACGLAFSVPDGMTCPRSLVNIFKELESDLRRPYPASGNLERWARQGILLLNAILTVRANQSGSHRKKGWEIFTDVVIRQLNDEREHLVFILWGEYARQKGAFINREKHCVIEGVHPSPLSAKRGFFGSRPFSRTNEYLENNGLTKIDW